MHRFFRRSCHTTPSIFREITAIRLSVETFRLKILNGLKSEIARFMG